MDHEDKLVVYSIFLVIACAVTALLYVIGEVEGACVGLIVILFISLFVILLFLLVTQRK